MTWEDNLASLKGKGLKDAAICGLKNADWWFSSDSAITQDELSVVVKNMGDSTILAQSGITLAGTKYMFLSGDDSICRAKKGTNGVHCAKSKTTLVVGIYDENMKPEEAATAVEKMADYLAANNA